MKIETLHDRGRDDRGAAHGNAKSNRIAGRLFTADSLYRTLERIIERDLFEPVQRRRPPIKRHAGQLTNANLRILQRRRLRIRPKVETVCVIVLVDENLRALFGRYRLLNRVRENLAERE